MSRFRGEDQPVFKVLETDINHNGTKELTVLTSNSSLDYDKTFVHISEFVGKGPAGGGGWMMAFDQQLARCDWYVFDMAVGQVNGTGWDEIVLGDGQWLSGPPESISYLKYDGPPGPFAWWPHFIEAGLPATCKSPMFLNLDADTSKELVIGGAGPYGYGSLYGLKYTSDTTWSVSWIDSTLRGGADNHSMGIVNQVPTIVAHGNRTYGPDLSYSKLEIFQDQGMNSFQKVSEIDLLKDSSAYLGLVLNDVDQDGKMNIIGGRSLWRGPENWCVDIEQDTTLSVVASSGTEPRAIRLAQNYPNPFNPTTAISFSIPKKMTIHLGVYNVLGQLVRALVDEEIAGGTYHETWDGKNQFGSDVGSGIYFYQLKTSGTVLTRKMLMLR